MQQAIESFYSDRCRQPSDRRGILDAAKSFHFVLPLRQIAMGTIACVSRAAKGFVSLSAHVDVGRSPLPDITALFEFAAFARRLPFVDDRQPSSNPAVIRFSVVEIHQDVVIFIFTLGITAVVT